MADVFRVGDLIGRPVAVDPTRPNAIGRATPVRDDPQDFPRYRVFKACRNCHRNYEGWSFLPQYDDDEAQAGWCDACVNRVAEERRLSWLAWDHERHQTPARRVDGGAVQRGHDPLREAA